jgi:hydroxymethyl cephem carbamoyltransferase
MKPGHDGSVAYIADGTLVFSFEAEKDSHPRFETLNSATYLRSLVKTPQLPDVIAQGGWYKVVPGEFQEVLGGYRGLEPGVFTRQKVFGESVAMYETSHERTHIYASVALCPFPTDDLAILVWEGIIGSLYRWSKQGASLEQFEVLDQPGVRYGALYAIAEPTFPDSGALVDPAFAGKLMALAAFADGQPPCDDACDVVDSLLATRSLSPLKKERYRRSKLYNCGVTDQEFARAARYLSERLFEIFHSAAHKVLEPGLPLVISGGCGLNCEWNSAWRACSHFSEVFVPPVTNDSGSAIGAAADALVQLGEDPRIEWDVYAGAEFEFDVSPEDLGWRTRPRDDAHLADCLRKGTILAWVEGRCEVGPRALGHRSLLASPCLAENHAALNRIKEREMFRPIAPVCLEAELASLFDRSEPDPHMLYFRRVRTPSQMPAVTHVDGSARVQSVNASTNPALTSLIRAFQDQTGVAALCNTSLNYKGRGFINRTSDLLTFCRRREIDHAVVEGMWLTRDNAYREKL